MTLTAGQILQSRYELLVLKHDGPGRQTWLALDQQSQARVMIKTLAFAGDIQWDDVQQFEREVAVLKRLHHPRMPSFVDAFNLDQPHFQKCLVETYIHAPTLQSFLDRNQSIPPTQIWAIAAQLLTILNDLHSLNPPIFHRDVNPSNILITSDKTVFLINLRSVGIQPTSTPDLGESPTTVGAYGYIPPEQYWGQGRPASDLYALGATLMALLTHISPAELMTPTFRLVFPETVALPAPLRQWLSQLTEPDLNSRFSTAVQALHQLQQAQSLASQLEQSIQDVTLSHDPGRITKTKTVDGWEMTVAPIWNRQTISTQDLVVLFALTTLPLIVGIPWAIALSAHAQGVGVLGADLLLLGLSLLPSLIVMPKLFRNLLEQTLEVSLLTLTRTRKIWGIPLQSITFTPETVRHFKCFQREHGWEIEADCETQPTPHFLVQLPAMEMDDLYRDLEQWRTLDRD